MKHNITIIMHSGGKVHGNRGPLSCFYMLPLNLRVHGLRVALTFKYAQVSILLSPF